MLYLPADKLLIHSLFGLFNQTDKYHLFTAAGIRIYYII